MPKNIIQDVVPPGKRTIRNIPIFNSRPRRPTPASPDLTYEKEKPPLPPAQSEPILPKRKSGFGKIFAGLGVLAVAGFTLFLITIFASAEVSVVPKREILSADLKTALPYEIVEVEKEAEKQVQANGEEEVEKKASGRITIYNKFSSESQRLIARTRFQTAEGLIYRISESVVVPGMGQVEATVYADEAGEKYNLSEAEFTVPGFKDDPKRFAGFYAKTKTAMAGGFIGKVKKVSKEDRETAIQNMESSLAQDLEREVRAKILDSQIAPGGSISYEFAELPDGSAYGDNAIVKRAGKARAVVLTKKSLESAIALKYLSSWNGLVSVAESWSGLTIALPEGADFSSSTLDLVIKGEVTMAAEINDGLISESLAGKPKADLKTIMANFPAVVSAQAAVKPVWKNAFPSDPSKIHITIAP